MKDCKFWGNNYGTLYTATMRKRLALIERKMNQLNSLGTYSKYKQYANIYSRLVIAY